MKIGNKTIGSGNPCFIIAEAGVNHNGDINTALEMVQTAANAEADAVKFQTFKVDQLASKKADKAEYQKKNTDSSESQYEMLKRLELSFEEYLQIIDECKARNIIFMSTPFDLGSVDLLEKLEMKAYKIPSGEITNLPLLEHVSSKSKPIILSTGMATLEEIEVAVDAIRKIGNSNLILMQCTSNYPADPKDINLKSMETLSLEFGVPVGFSDHTLGIEVAIAAVALGACVIEKHFTLNKSLPGPDHKMSLDPDELTSMVSGIRNIELAFGTGVKTPSEPEKAIAKVARRSIHYNRDLIAGTVLMEHDLCMLRPEDGVSPAKLPDFVGRKLAKDITSGSKLTPDDFR